VGGGVCHFVLAGVILLGMLTQALLYGSYEVHNADGQQNTGLLVFALFVYAWKKTVFRLFVLVVAMGFGVVKSTLGETMRRILGIGVAYLLVSFAADVSQAFTNSAPEDSSARQAELFFLAPSVLMNVAIGYWVFLSLHQTMMQVSMRRQLIKLSVYRKFAWMLGLCVGSGVAFMLWSIVYRKTSADATLSMQWLNVAFWHILFSFVLVVMCVLWRPSRVSLKMNYSSLSRGGSTMPFDVADEEDDADGAHDEMELLGRRSGSSGDGHGGAASGSGEDTVPTGYSTTLQSRSRQSTVGATAAAEAEESRRKTLSEATM
jgi:hypothetical protein